MALSTVSDANRAFVQLSKQESILFGALNHVLPLSLAQLVRMKSNIDSDVQM